MIESNTLTFDIHFFAAALSQAKVSVWVRHSDNDTVTLEEYGGTVEKYTPMSVKINGAYYVRSSYEFRVEP
jgi:hypothetical protein